MENRLGKSANLVDTTSGSIPTPASGALSIFSEGGKLKQKDPAGVVTDLTTIGGATAVVATRIRRSTNQSIPTGVSYTDLAFDTSGYQSNGTFWTTGATITVPESGYYQVFAEATFEGAAVAVTCNMQVLVNGSLVIGDDEKMVAASSTAPMWTMAQRLFAAGDTIKVQVKHSNATALNILTQGDHSPDIILAKLNGAKGDNGTGDVGGPASSTATAFSQFLDATGKVLKNSKTTEDSGGNVQVRGNIEAKESGFTRVVKAWASDVINFVNIYHTGTGAGTGYGIIESTTGFVLAAGATFSTAITGTATYQAIVQYAGGAYNSIRFGHNDTDGEINTTAGKLKLNPFGIVEILKNVLISGTDARIEMKGVTNDPAVPATGNLHFFAKDIAGRMYPRVLTPTGFDTTLQASSMFNTFQKIQPGSGTAFYVEGNSITSVGTISHPAQADTNLKTRNRRAVNTSVATAGGLASTRVNSAEFSRNTGFSVVIRFSLDTLAAGMRSFVGISDTLTAPTNVDPTTSTAGGKIGMAINANTGNWNLIYNATGVAPTVIALGASFPVDATTMYELVLDSMELSTTIGYRVKNSNTGITASGTLTTNIPTAATFMGRLIWATNNATAAAVAWSITKIGLETDY